MKNIFILLVLLPFSLFADINPSDLDTLEGYTSDILNETIEIKNKVSLSETHLQYIRQMIYTIQSEITNADLDYFLSSINDRINVTNTRLTQIKDLVNTDFNLVLEQLQGTNRYLFDITTEIEYLKQYQDTLLNYQDSINSQISSLISSISVLVDYLSQISTSLEGLNETVQNIYTELLSQGLDIKDIKNFILSSSVSESVIMRYIKYNRNPLESPLGQSTTLYVSATNYYDSVLGYFSALFKGFGFLNETENFSTRQNYVVITNLQKSIVIQTDISTNVAYIASVITNSHDLLKLIASNVVKIARNTMPTNFADQYETQQQQDIKDITKDYVKHENDMSSYESQLTHIPSKVQDPLDGGIDYISRLNSPSTFEVNTLDDAIYAGLPDYHSSLANMSFSLPIDIQLTPDLKQILSIVRKCVTTVIWVFTFLFSLFMIQKFVQFVEWIMSLLQPYTRDMFGNVGSGSLYKLMGG